MRYFTLSFVFLLFTNYSYGTDSLFRYKLALRVASIPAVKNLTHSLKDIHTEQLTLQPFTKYDNYLDKIEEDLALFTCAQHPKKIFQWIIKHNETVKNIGLVGLHTIDEKNASGTLALYLDPEYRNEEILTEVIRAVVNLGFSIGLNRIDFYLYPDKRGFTETSLACDSLGFIKIGEIPEFIYHSGCYHTFILYSILESSKSSKIGD